MLFNSHVFIFLFLPASLLGYFVLCRMAPNGKLPLAWLLLVSLFFYGWWEAKYLLLLITSISVNFLIGRKIFQSKNDRWLLLGISFNIGLLAYFKYAFFLAESFGSLLDRNWTLGEITLPLAISFFTFQQITWLVDVARSKAEVPSFLRYALFVSFFPQLIAGPIVHHSEMMPQFGKRFSRQLALQNLNIGLTLFSFGLFKKIVLADQFAVFANPVFDAAARGSELSLIEAWMGTLSYTFQLYFDFSGYSDMAIGLARMMGIILPLNFFSPYRAGNIREFWQRWHITLSRFLRDYVYIPLGGNRASEGRVACNIMVTMLVGGLWHGAGWTFVAWGGLHGLFLLIHRGYGQLRSKPHLPTRAGKALGIFLTFTAVSSAWVLFRAESFAAAMQVYQGMFGFNGSAIKPGMEIAMAWLAGGAVISLLLPNTYQLMAAQKPALIPASVQLEQNRVSWRANASWAVLVAIVFCWSVLSLNQVSEFLYFQF
jgi:D-alanyl-lipoteichoic acid acyltransferase DltB (MBOAT superfamily)